MAGAQNATCKKNKGSYSMTDLQTRILEVEADDDVGRLARALEDVTRECYRIRKVAHNLAHPDSPVHDITRSIAFTQAADSVLEVLNKAIGADDAA